MNATSHKDKVIGIIGGLGPQATVDFLVELSKNPGHQDQEHLHVIIDNNPKVPNRNEAIAGVGPSPIEMFTASARRLQAAGAELLVMPCNTAHAFKQGITDHVDIPFIDIINETTDHVTKQYPTAQKIGLLATDGCLQSRLYHQHLFSHGVEPVCLAEASQEVFMTLIYKIKSGGVDSSIKKAMKNMAIELIEAGAQVIIAGCTEVPLVLHQNDLSVPLIDSTDILAQQCVAYARNELVISNLNSG